MTAAEIANLKTLAEEAKRRTANIFRESRYCDWAVEEVPDLADGVVKLADDLEQVRKVVGAWRETGIALIEDRTKLRKRLEDAKQWMTHHEACPEEPCYCGLDKFLEGETDAEENGPRKEPTDG